MSSKPNCEKRGAEWARKPCMARAGHMAPCAERLGTIICFICLDLAITGKIPTTMLLHKEKM
jgi:hypothetical protein